jgi:hypothetical protein
MKKLLLIVSLMLAVGAVLVVLRGRRSDITVSDWDDAVRDVASDTGAAAKDAASDVAAAAQDAADAATEATKA